MKRLLLLSLLVPALAAAGVPDEDMILDRTMDAQSAFYYPALMMRYNAGDETLTDEDYHYLYYGYAYRDEYKPLAVNPDLDKMLMLASGIDPDKPDRATLETMVSMGNDALKRDPFSPKILNLMSFAYGALGDKEQEKAWSDRMNGVIRTILGSGDGFTQKTPRHVLMFDHALDVLTVEGFSYDKSRVISRTVEYIPRVKKDEKGVKGYYFDYGRIYWKKPEQGYKRERSWQFNNLKPWKSDKK